SLTWAGMRPEDRLPVRAVKAGRGVLDQLQADGFDMAVIDTAAGTSAARLASRWLDQVDAIVVPVLPSGIDLDASLPYLQTLAELPGVADRSVAVGVVVNRLRPRTRTGRDALAEMADDFPFKVVARL